MPSTSQKCSAVLGTEPYWYQCLDIACQIYVRIAVPVFNSTPNLPDK